MFSRDTVRAMKISKKVIVSTPINLFGKTRRRLNEERKYHSGRISRGVEKALEGEMSSNGETMDKPKARLSVPNMTPGNMYSMSFGHAGSP